jgi:ABC-2 type transport system ATP-binding protein
MDAIAIETKELTRRFGSTLAVDHVSIRVPVGCFYGFLGPNGAGKSTTVRMLTGLLAPTEGEALIEGRSILAEPVVVKRGIGVLPDDLALFERLSFWEHLTMIGRIYGLTLPETERRAEDLLRLLDLWEHRGVYAIDGSHGMRKKLALAVALIHNPRVLFLDEPFEGIDPIAGKHVRDLLLKLTDRGVTVFLTSHILEIIERLVDRVAVIVEGRIKAETDLADLKRAGRTVEELFVEAVGGRPDSVVELPWLA